MIQRILGAVLGFACIATTALAEGPFRMTTMGIFDLSFVDDVIALDTSGRLEMVDLNSTPGPDTGPEIIALLAQDWNAAKTQYERLGDQQIWHDMEPNFDPNLLARRVDIARENGTSVRLYVFAAYLNGELVPRGCQAAVIARDFAEVGPFPTLTLEHCADLTF